MDDVLAGSRSIARPFWSGLGLLRVVADAMYLGYAGLFVGAGLAGMLFPIWAPWPGLHLDPFGGGVFNLPMDPTLRAAALAQYRFFRSLELCVGVGLLVYRRRVFESRNANRVFVGLAGMGVLARLLSIAFDGRPYDASFFFLGGEAATTVAVYAAARPTGGTR